MLVALYAHCNFRYKSFNPFLNVFMDNFSQLGAWPKTAQAVFITSVFLFSAWFCQHNIQYIKSLDTSLKTTRLDSNKIGSNKPPNLLGDHYSSLFDSQKLFKCNVTQPTWADGQFGSPLFVWELFLDFALAVILVAFLNYQVTSFLFYLLMRYKKFSLKLHFACHFMGTSKPEETLPRCKSFEIRYDSVYNFCSNLQLFRFRQTGFLQI